MTEKRVKRRILSWLWLLHAMSGRNRDQQLCENVTMLRRAPSDAQLTPEMQAKMKKIENCLHCNKCKSKCPYGLDTPTLLQKNYEDYKRVLAGEVSVK